MENLLIIPFLSSFKKYYEWITSAWDVFLPAFSGTKGVKALTTANLLTLVNKLKLCFIAKLQKNIE